MESLGKVLEKSFHEFGIDGPIKRYRALTLWRDVVGGRIAEMTEARRVTGGKIFVKVRNDAWRNELVFHKKEIIRRLNERLGARIVDEIILI